MTIETLTRAQLASELGYTDGEGNPSERALAQFMRDALGRWGLCPKRALFKHARDQLRAGGVETETVPRVFERLVALGECAEVGVGHESYVAPAEPRWVDVGGGLGVLLGPLTAPSETLRLTTLDPSDVAVRVHVDGDEAAAALEARGARRVSLEEWLHPLSFLHHVARRWGEPARADQLGLARFWERLVDAVSSEGLQLDDEAELRAVVGAPGGFFGKHSAAMVEGRWSSELDDGVWCAYRRGHGEGHWLPTLVTVEGDERRALDLFNDDEWRWALLARGCARGADEVVRREEDLVHVTWPLPAQLRAAMDLVGIPEAPWRWRVSPAAPDLWALLK